MSEYQYYDFLAIDKPLSAEARQYIQSLSSRVVLTASSASFVYHYGDFPADPYKVLRDYFDAMLYISNFGNRQLMFRFPEDAIPSEIIQNYQFENAITWTKEGAYRILNIEYYDEGGDSWGWVEGEGLLAGIAQVREDILRGDYRALYLAWLKMAEYEAAIMDYDDEDEDEKASRLIEPPVPAALQNLSAALESFIEFYEISEDLVTAAAEASPAPTKTAKVDYHSMLEKLSDTEKTAFLERLLNGERFLEIALAKRLAELAGTTPSQATNAGKRSIGELLERAKILKKERQAEAKRQAKIARDKHLDKIAKEEASLWARMPYFIEMKSASGYDEMLKILLDLRDLAERDNRLAEFQAKVKAIAEANRTRSGLQRRLSDAKLI